MSAIAALLTRCCDLLVSPFGGAAGWALAVLSALAGVGLLALFKATTRQSRLRLARRQLSGHVYELGLYQENLGVMLRIQRDLAAANLRYLALTLPALAALTLPLLLILPQFEARFAHRPLRPGEATVVTATVAPGQERLLAGLRLAGDDGLRVESFPVRDRAARTAQWRVRAQSPGTHAVTLHAADGEAGWTKRVVVGSSLRAQAGERVAGGPLAALLSPAESPLPAGAPIVRLAVALPARDARCCGLPLGWLAGFCVWSILGGLAAKPWLRVEI